MLTKTIHTLFIRDLTKLRSEINAYTHEDRLWYIEKSISNSAGSLCLHLVGNLNFFIGTTLGNTGYVRNRDEEFSLKGLSKNELLIKIDATIAMMDTVMPQLDGLDVQQLFPILVFQEKTSIEYFIIHLAGHLNYHLGQINYHRRLLDQ